GQHGHRGGHLQPFGPSQDRGHHDVRRGDGVVGAVVFTEADEINADLFCEYGLVDDITQGLRMGYRVALQIHGGIAEGVDAEGEVPGGRALWRHASWGLSWVSSESTCGYSNNVRGKMFPGPFVNPWVGDVRRQARRRAVAQEGKSGNTG